jgi:hypothetical protein
MLAVRARPICMLRAGSLAPWTLRLAVEHPMQTGEYRTIATPWGVEKGMIDSR